MKFYPFSGRGILFRSASQGGRRPAYLYKSAFLQGCFSGFAKPVVIRVFGETALCAVLLYGKARILPVSKRNHPVLQADLSCNKLCVHSTRPGLKNVKSVHSTFSTLSQIRCSYSRDEWFTIYINTTHSTCNS